MILFNPSEVDKLNDAFSQVSACMFFAAYYAPNPAIKENLALNLRIAVTNGYGLLIDCGNYLVTWARKLESKQVLSSQDQQTIGRFIWLFKDLRSLFCHNQAKEISSVNRQISNVMKSLGEIGINCNKYESMRPFLVTEGPSQYSTIISRLNDGVQAILNIFSKLIRKYDKLTREQKDFVFDSWCEAVAEWYYRSTNFRFQVESDIFNLWCQSKGYNNRWRHGGAGRACFNDWKNNVEVDWKQSRRDILTEIQMNIQNSRGPAYPMDVLKQVLGERCGSEI